jgi:uncharacterized protein involved in exopolysaccharide biosynthesis
MRNMVMKINEPKKEGMRDFLTIFFKHRTRMLIVFFSVILTVAAFSFLQSPVYEAKSTILIKYGREYMSRSEVGDAPPVRSLDEEEVINSEIQILRSRDLAKKVIETIKLKNMYPGLLKNPSEKINPMDLAINRFSKSLGVDGVSKSSVITVSFHHSNPQIAAKSVNLLIDYYKDKHLQVFSGPQSSFMEQQVSDLRKKLFDSENNLQSFKQKNRIYSLDEQRSLLLKQRTDLSSELMASQDRVNGLEKRLTTLKGQTRNLLDKNYLYTPTERDKIIVDAKSKLLALQLSEQELLRKYNEKNMLVVDTRKQIQVVKKFLSEQEADIRHLVPTGNLVYQDAQKGIITTAADLNSERANLGTLSVQLKELDRKIQSLDMREKDLLNLKREIATNEKNFETYGGKMVEARILDDMNRLKLANISIIEAASVPIRPIKPKKALNLVLGVIFGALSSIGLAFLHERNRQTLTDPESAERRLNLAVIGCIPYKE